MPIWRFGSDVNTDEIIPGRYNVTTDENQLAKHCFCEVRPEFPKDVQEGDFIVAGENFGCGSSREHAPIAIKAAGIKAVIAKSFARIFYRNSINIGLPIMTCRDADKIGETDELEVDLGQGIITNKTKDEQYNAEPMPEFVMNIINAGGIINMVQKKGTL